MANHRNNWRNRTAYFLAITDEPADYVVEHLVTPKDPPLREDGARHAVRRPHPAPRCTSVKPQPLRVAADAVEPLGQPPQLPAGAAEGGAEAAGDRGAGQAPAVEVVQEVLGVGHGGPQLGEPGVQRGGLGAAGRGPRSALQLPGDGLDPEERRGEARQAGVPAGQGAGAPGERREVL